MALYLKIAVFLILVSACTAPPDPAPAPEPTHLSGMHGPEAGPDAIAADGQRINYVFWERYLAGHGARETVSAFETLLGEREDADADALGKSFERFCRFSGCLDEYRNAR